MLVKWHPEPYIPALQIHCFADTISGAKLRIVEALTQQLLTFVATRDLLEDNYDKLKQAKSDLRSMQAQKNHREKEEATFW